VFEGLGIPTSTIAPIVVTIGLAVISLYFKWLMGSFKRVELQVESVQELAQLRHEENLRRFEKISVALARLGSSNGTH
jgi:hypothetical protein